MADVVFDSGLEVFRLAVSLLIYGAIAINIISRKDLEKLYFLFMLAGYYYVSTVVNDFFLATTFITMWFIVVGVDFFVPKYVLIAMLALLLFLDYANPLFFFIAIILYVVTTTNFIFSSFRLLAAKKGKAA